MFDNHYRRIGTALKLQGIEDAQKDVKTLVKNALERDDINSWLLIIDNADDTDLLFNESGLASYIPHNHSGSILLTTRNKNERQRHEAIGTLMAYAFIIRRGSTESFDVHRLVRLVMRNWLKEQGKERQQAAKTIGWLSASFPRPNKLNKDLWVAYMPHVQSALKVSQMSTGGRPLWDLMRHAGNGSRLLRKTEEAEQMHRQALELKEKVLGPEDPEVLASLHDLAVTLDHGAFFKNNQEKNKEAEKILRRVLCSRERALGAAHPNTLMTLHDLAFVLQCQGKNAAAEKMLRQTLQLKKQVLGPKDPNTLMTLASLADTISDQNRYEEAEQV